MPRGRRSVRLVLAGAGAAGVLAAATVIVTTVGGGAAPSPGEALRDYYSQKPSWSPCPFDRRLDCASVKVPRDYARPDREQVTIAVSRLKATDADRRRGVLVALNGGPGGIGVGGMGRAMPTRIAGSAVHRVYDVVGFEPRGTGSSTPLYCEVAKPRTAFDSRPADAAFPGIAADARDRDAACQRRSDGLRPYVNTRATARDLDVIRGVLGERKISYVGYAYGSLVGAVYGDLFGGRLDRTVLDSAVNADGDWRRQFMGQAVATGENVEEWAEWTARNDARFGLGSTRTEVLATVDETASKLAARPVSGVTRTVFDGAMGPGTAYRPLWADLGDMVAELRTPTRQDRTADAAKAALALARAAMGGLTSPPGARLRPGVLDAVTCESRWPTDLNVYERDMRTYRERLPYGYGVMRAGPWGCAFGSFSPSERTTPPERSGYPPGLVIQAEGDTVTDYPGGKALAARLGHRLVSVTDEGLHELYAHRGNRCVDATADRYLVDGVLPSGDVTCRGTPRPDPGGSSRAGGDRLGTSVRDYIQRKGLM